MNKILILYLTFTPFFLFSQEAFVIDDYHVDVVIDTYGDCHITEDIQLRFTEERRGINRKIPLKGKFKSHTQSLEIKDVQVKNFKFSTKNVSGNLEIKIGDKNTYITGPQNYIISFTAGNGLLNFENHEEFYWTLISPEWDTDIRNASFSIRLPKSINLNKEDMQVFSGTVGENTSFGNIKQTGPQTIEGKSLTLLGNGKGLTVGIRFPKGYFFAHPNQVVSSDNRLPKDNAFPLPILLILGLILGFKKWGRADKDEETEDRFYAPDDMPPSEVGAYIDHKVNDRDLIALIPQWGAEGLIKVRAATAADIYIEKITDIPAGRPEYESYFFHELFRQSDIVYIDDLKHSFYKEFGKAKRKLKEAIDPEYYDEDAIANFHSKKMIFLGIGAILIGVLWMIFMRQIFTGIGFIIAGFVAFVIYSREPKKSEKGLLAHRDLKNLQRTLREDNSNSLAEVMDRDPNYLEKIFPYVVALGLEDEWTKKFSSLSEKAPDWYYYEDGRRFGYTDFSRDFNTSKISQTISTPPVASSSSSSFGSGGSSGGGFGGGGGSSW